jgi:hypothetical protein
MPWLSVTAATRREALAILREAIATWLQTEPDNFDVEGMTDLDGGR